MPRQDQIAIGKAIVGRLGRDDHWVTNGTAGWTFAAATLEFPVEGARPVNVDRLRQVLQQRAAFDSDIHSIFYVWWWLIQS